MKNLAIFLGGAVVGAAVAALFTPICRNDCLGN